MSTPTHTVFKGESGNLSFVSRIHEIDMPYSIDHGKTITVRKEVCRVYWTTDAKKAAFFPEEKAKKIQLKTRRGRLLEFHSHRVHILGDNSGGGK